MTCNYYCNEIRRLYMSLNLRASVQPTPSMGRLRLRAWFEDLHARGQDQTVSMIGVGGLALLAVGIEFMATKFGLAAAHGFARSFGSQLGTLKYLVTQTYYMWNPTGGMPNPMMSLGLIVCLSVLQFIAVGGSRFADSPHAQDQAQFRAAGMVNPSADMRTSFMQAAQVATAAPVQAPAQGNNLMTSLLMNAGPMLASFMQGMSGGGGGAAQGEVVAPPFEVDAVSSPATVAAAVAATSPPGGGGDYLPSSSADAYASMASTHVRNPSHFADL